MRFGRLPPLLLLAACAAAPATRPSTRPAPLLDDPTPQSPVSAVMWVETDPVQPGNDIEVDIVLRVAPGHWLYATTAASSPFTGVQLKLKHDSAVRETVSLIQPTPDAKGHLTGKVGFRQRLHVSPDLAPGRHTLSCDLTYQACNPDLCWPPQAMQLKTEFEVSAHLKN